VYGGRSARSLTARLFLVFVASSCVSFIRSILSVDFWCTKFADGPYYSAGWSVSRRTVHGSITDGPFSRCTSGGSGSIIGRSALYPRTIRALITDGPPVHHGQSAWCFPDCLSPSLVELCFRVALSRDSAKKGPKMTSNEKV
jgi:hypothetical protein